MKRSLLLGAAVIACACAAAAQEVPKFETFLGYTFTHFSPDSNFSSELIPAASTFDAHGGEFELGWNYNKWIGLVVDGSAAHHGDIGDFGRGTAVNFVAGPRVSYRKWSRVRLFAEVMAGGVWYNGSVFVPLLTPVEPPNNGVVVVPSDTVIRGRENQGQVAFAFLAGGGADIRISKHVSFRPIQADYYMTRIKNMQNFDDDHQNNFRYSAGINFTFGAR
jgi:hypothetical protein